MHHDCLRRWILESIGGFASDSTEQITESYSSSVDRPSADDDEEHHQRLLMTSSRINNNKQLVSSETYAVSCATYSVCPQSLDVPSTSSMEPHLSSSHQIRSTTTSNRHSSGRMDMNGFRVSSGGLSLLLGGSDHRHQLRCKVCNQPYQLQTSFMIQCQVISTIL